TALMRAEHAVQNRNWREARRLFQSVRGLALSMDKDVATKVQAVDQALADLWILVPRWEKAAAAIRSGATVPETVSQACRDVRRLVELEPHTQRVNRLEVWAECLIAIFGALRADITERAANGTYERAAELLGGRIEEALAQIDRDLWKELIAKREMLPGLVG